MLLNRGVLVGHHTTIGDFATLQPGANVAGLCSIGERAFLGMGAIVIDRRTVGTEAIVGAAALVVEDVPANVRRWSACARDAAHRPR